MKILLCVTSLVLIMSVSSGAFASPPQYVVVPGREKRMPIPKSYEATKVIWDLGQEAGFLDGAEDIFIDGSDILYVADTGNNRIVKVSANGSSTSVFHGPEGSPFREPKGIYVDRDGDLYVADTGNKRIVHLAADGQFIEEFTRPKAEMPEENTDFEPTKVFINSIGIIHIINKSESRGIITIDANDEFAGIVGATEIGFDLNEMLIGLFASETQKRRVARRLPPPYSNLVIDDSGMVFVTVVKVSSHQVHKINSIGRNLFKDRFVSVGEMRDDRNMPVTPYLVDLAVDANGIVSVLEQKTGKIYQYDSEGNPICVFGGIGRVKGLFQKPTSLAVDSSGRMYVLDNILNSIQVFEPTRFIRYVHEATRLYHAGEYAQSREFWGKVLSIDAQYSLALKNIGLSLWKEGEWTQAMERFQEADDPEGYSKAFADFRHSLYRMHFGILLLAGTTVLALAMLLLRRLRKVADRAL